MAENTATIRFTIAKNYGILNMENNLPHLLHQCRMGNFYIRLGGNLVLDLKDINHRPTIQEIEQYINNTVFNQFFHFLNTEYQALCNVEYSKDVWFRGWNVKLRKAGKSLCVIYPKQGYFTVLVVIGIKEQEKFNALFPMLSKEIKEIYNHTNEGNGQRWLMIDIKQFDHMYGDILKLIKIRRESK